MKKGVVLFVENYLLFKTHSKLRTLDQSELTDFENPRSTTKRDRLDVVFCIFSIQCQTHYSYKLDIGGCPEWLTAIELFESYKIQTEIAICMSLSQKNNWTLS